MVRVFVRERGESASISPPRREVKLEKLEGTAVEDLLSAVAAQLNLERHELNLTYGGRLLKAGKTLDHYQIKDGCTLYIMKQKKKMKYAPLPLGPEGMTVVLGNPTIQSEIAPFLQDPELVTKMIPMGNLSEVKGVLEDPDLLAKISDMVRINHYIRRNHILLPVMQALLRLHRIRYSVQDSGRVEQLSMQVGQILGLTGDQSAQQVPVEVPTEASVSHSGQDLMHGTLFAATPDSFTVSSADGGGDDDLGSALPSLAVTPADLATALASIGSTGGGGGELGSGHSSSLSLEESSQPLSIPLLPGLPGSSAPASLQETDVLPVPPTVNRSLSDSGHGNTGHGNMGMGQSGGSPLSISEVDLQHALSLAFRNTQMTPSSASQAPPTTSHTHRAHRHRHHANRSHHSQRQQRLREMYMPHLEQLHTMGITYSDSECLHALEAAQGDLQTALEILMGGPGD